MAADVRRNGAEKLETPRHAPKRPLPEGVHFCEADGGNGCVCFLGRMHPERAEKAGEVGEDGAGLTKPQQ
jgi:hypothetical protein